MRKRENMWCDGTLPPEDVSFLPRHHTVCDCTATFLRGASCRRVRGTQHHTTVFSGFRSQSRVRHRCEEFGWLMPKIQRRLSAPILQVWILHLKRPNGEWSPSSLHFNEYEDPICAIDRLVLFLLHFFKTGESKATARFIWVDRKTVEWVETDTKRRAEK